MNVGMKDADIQRLLVRERSRQVLGADKQQAIRERLHRVIVTELQATQSRPKSLAVFWHWLVVRPLVVVTGLLFAGGLAMAVLKTRGIVWDRAPALSPSVSVSAAPPRTKNLPATETETLQAELTLIARARRALAAGNVKVGERALEQHAQQFAAGRLIEEREGLRVMALWHNGRHEAARQAAQRFSERYPVSPMLRPLKALLDSAP